MELCCVSLVAWSGRVKEGKAAKLNRGALLVEVCRECKIVGEFATDPVDGLAPEPSFRNNLQSQQLSMTQHGNALYLPLRWRSLYG